MDDIVDWKGQWSKHLTFTAVFAIFFTTGWSEASQNFCRTTSEAWLNSLQPRLSTCESQSSLCRISRGSLWLVALCQSWAFSFLCRMTSTWKPPARQNWIQLTRFCHKIMCIFCPLVGPEPGIFRLKPDAQFVFQVGCEDRARLQID